MKLINIPVPINTIIIKGIIPKGISSVGKVWKNSKLPGNDQTKSNNGWRLPKISEYKNTIAKIVVSVIIPRIDFFIIKYF